MIHKTSKSTCFLDAACQGRVEDVRVLMKGRTKDEKSKALRWAAVGGHVECVILLIPVSNPKAFSSDALRVAAYHGHVECVKALIPVSDPKASDSVALVAATKNRHIECVRLLIGVSNPKDFNSEALQYACLNNDQDCFDLLYDVSDPIAALNRLQKNSGVCDANMRLLKERLEANRQNGVIAHAVGSVQSAHSTRKM